MGVTNYLQRGMILQEGDPKPRSSIFWLLTGITPMTMQRTKPFESIFFPIKDEVIFQLASRLLVASGGITEHPNIHS